MMPEQRDTSRFDFVVVGYMQFAANNIANAVMN